MGLSTQLERNNAQAPGSQGSAAATVTERARGPSWKRARVKLAIAGLAVAAIVGFALSIVLGSVAIPIDQVFAIITGQEADRFSWGVIVRDVRLPRAITATLAGAALGIAGLQMQTLLRNPLADPFALGITSGASLGVAIVVLGMTTTIGAVFGAGLGLAGDAAIAAAAIIGALAALAPVLAISAQVKNPATVLIVGLMFGYAVQAFVTFMVVGSSFEQLQRWITWGFGSFTGVTWPQLTLFVPLLMVGIALAASSTKQLNALLLGETYAQSIGLNARRTRLLILAGASVLAGVVTAFCGPIAFLGIAIPHIARALTGTSDHRVLVPAVVLAGAALALIAQIVALVIGRDGMLPLNAVTSIIGAPIVILVVLRTRRGAFVG
ncbi:MAG: iron chelate uptake ABC transporter family permease subunit [Alphaproteobacteria bacterium]